MTTLAIVLHLVILHGVDGREIYINPELVTSMHAATDQNNKLVVQGVRCVVGLSDGKFISVAENCNMVQRLLEEIK